MSWTDDRVAVLKKLWGEGKTAAEIAKELGGVTRNAVIGKAHRLKLSNRVSPIQQNKKPVAPKPKPQSPEKKPPIKMVTAQEDLNRDKLDLIDLGARQCRWPIGDPRLEGFGFCGDTIVAGLPYCEAHAKAAYQTSSRTKVLKAEDFEKPTAEERAEAEIKKAVGGNT